MAAAVAAATARKAELRGRDQLTVPVTKPQPVVEVPKPAQTASELAPQIAQLNIPAKVLALGTTSLVGTLDGVPGSATAGRVTPSATAGPAPWWGRILGGASTPDDTNAKRTWAPPNLTSDPSTGRLAAFSEDDFVARLRAGLALPGSPMPWQQFQNMHEDDLRAIYRYLRTVPPAVHDTGPAFVDKQ